jgi:FKBP-type peptidyl-prolyl cis-trans isomerase FklB
MQKSLILLLWMTAAAAAATAQVKKKPATPSVQPGLKTSVDSLSYSIGLMVASFYKQQGITDINSSLVTRAINDEMKNGQPLLTEPQANGVLMSYIQKIKADKAAANKKAGEAFLAANKSKPGVVTTASGLQYTILKEGTGPKPVSTDTVKCTYEGRLIDGTIFDSSDKQGGQPIQFTVNGVIAGWTEALQLMPVGSKWRLFIPAELAYGDNSPGAAIKPGSALIFEVELLEIAK